MSKACIVTSSFQPNPDNIMYFYESCKNLFIAVNTSITSTCMLFILFLTKQHSRLQTFSITVQCKTYSMRRKPCEVVFYEFIKDEGQVLNTV
jgi:hypothetical protein